MIPKNRKLKKKKEGDKPKPLQVALHHGKRIANRAEYEGHGAVRRLAGWLGSRRIVP